MAAASGHARGLRPAALPLAGFLLCPLRFDVDVGQDESILAELFDVIEHVTDQVNGDLVEDLQPAVDDLEDVLARIGLANVHDYVFGICGVHSQHLGRLILIDHFLDQFLFYDVVKGHLPRGGRLADDSGQR